MACGLNRVLGANGCVLVHAILVLALLQTVTADSGSNNVVLSPPRIRAPSSWNKTASSTFRVSLNAPTFGRAKFNIMKRLKPVYRSFGFAAGKYVVLKYYNNPYARGNFSLTAVLRVPIKLPYGKIVEFKKATSSALLPVVLQASVTNRRRKPKKPIRP